MRNYVLAILTIILFINTVLIPSVTTEEFKQDITEKIDEKSPCALWWVHGFAKFKKYETIEYEGSEIKMVFFRPIFLQITDLITVNYRFTIFDEVLVGVRFPGLFRIGIWIQGMMQEPFIVEPLD